MFFLVSGAAAAGKSTLLRNISIQIENLECHDHDEKKVVDEYTRCQQLEEWVQSALQFHQEGQDFLLTSHSPLGELLVQGQRTLLEIISWRPILQRNVRPFLALFATLTGKTTREMPYLAVLSSQSATQNGSFVL